MRSRSPANSADSSPPSPALISTMTSLSSLGSLGSSCLRRSALRSVELGLQRVDLAGEGGVLAGVLPGHLEIAGRLGDPAGDLDDRRQLGVATTQLAGPAGIGVDGGVGELGLELGVLAQEIVERLAHNRLQEQKGYSGHDNGAGRKDLRSLLPAPRRS